MEPWLLWSFPSPVSSLSPFETSLAGTLLCRALVAPGLGVALLEVAVTFSPCQSRLLGISFPGGLFRAAAEQVFVLTQLQTPGVWFKASCNVCWLLLGISCHSFALTQGCCQSCSSCPRAGASSSVPITWAGPQSPFSIMALHPGRSLPRAHSLKAEPDSATHPGCPHVPVLLLCLPILLPLCETLARRWTLNRFCLHFSLPAPGRAGSRGVAVLDGDNDVQLEKSFAALSAVQDCEISGLSSCLSLKLLVAVCSGADLFPRGQAEVGPVLESLLCPALPPPGRISCCWFSPACGSACSVSEPRGWPGSSPEPHLLLLLLFSKEHQRCLPGFLSL